MPILRIASTMAYTSLDNPRNPIEAGRNSRVRELVDAHRVRLQPFEHCSRRRIFVESIEMGSEIGALPLDAGAGTSGFWSKHCDAS